jgi:hypothetical protein
VGVRVSDQGVLPLLQKRLPPGSRRSTAETVDCLFSVISGGRSDRPRVKFYNLAYANHERLARSLDLDSVLDAFEAGLRLWVAFLAPRRLFVHAGAVAWNGEAILVRGRSFSGKTSLIGELVKAGATYYSDEFAVLDKDGRAHPFVTPLAVRQDGTGPQTNIPVEEIGGRAGSRPVPVGLVLISEFKEGARWQPRPLSPGNGALALLSNTVPARRTPARALAVLQRVVSRATVLKSRRGEAGAVASNILDILANRVRSARRLDRAMAAADHEGIRP